MNSATEHAGNETAEEMLLTEVSGSIATLTLNRPSARNALSEPLLVALGAQLDAIAADRTIAAVIITGAAPAFCAGHDLREMTAARDSDDRGRAAFEHLFVLCSTVMQKIVNLPQPVIAAVEGIATAAGCQLVATCDLAIASRESRFATPGVHIGLFCSTPMVALSRNLSRKHAMEMLLTGDLVSAQDAVRMGLINKAVEPGTAMAEARALAEKIASKAAAVTAIGKRAFYHQAELPLDEAYDYGSRVMAENMLLASANEGIGAFVGKRAAEWPEESPETLSIASPKSAFPDSASKAAPKPTIKT
jgi:enoyl-CoA hydratase/carnithine racemase